VAKKRTPEPVATPVSRQERVIGYMFASILVLSIVAIIALFIGNASAKGGFWPVVQILPLIGLPLAILLLITLLVLTAIRRGRDARDADK
jgi:uncharacterized membrane protein YdjX (TVP38/TMEM64 family)